MSKFRLDIPTKADAPVFSFRPMLPSIFTHEPIEVTKNLGCQISPDKPALFQFGSHKSDAEKKFETKFNFMLNIEKLDESNSDTEINISSVKEAELKSNDEPKHESFEDVVTEDTNKKCAIQIQNEESNEQKQKSDKGDKQTDEKINIKILFKEFKEIINEFSNERAEYEKRITALELRIQALESNRKLEQSDTSSTSKGGDVHNTAPINSAKDMSFAIQPLPIAIPSFITPQTAIFGSTPLFSSNTAQTPANFVFGTTAFPNKSAKASTTELFIPNTQLNSSPFIVSTPIVQTSFLSNTESTTSKELNSNSKENSNLYLFNKQINTDSFFANKGNSTIGSLLNINEGHEKSKQMMASNDIKHEKNQMLEGISSIDNFEKSVEQSFQKAMKDISMELKSLLTNVYNKKN